MVEQKNTNTGEAYIIKNDDTVSGVQTDTPTVGQQQQSPSQPSRRTQRLIRLQQKKVKKQVAQYQEAVKIKNRQLKRELQILAQRIGKEDFKLLKQICTVQVPEEKNEAGEITKKASSYVNYQALITESKHLAVLQREERIKSGKRKRSSGNSRNRKAHRSMLAFLQNRNLEASSEPVKVALSEPVTTEKS